MRKLFTLLLALAPFATTLAQEETEITTAEAKTLYKNTSKKWISIHDPSVVWEPTNKRYYIFGSHKAGAYSTDMQNWTGTAPTWRVGSNINAANKDAFVTPAVTKVKKGGAEVDFPAFDAVEWSARTDDAYNVDGNMWAPDVIWNPVMKKWCMYLSINGDAWHSSIVLLTSTSITGPYTYQGPVVICGFQDSKHSYKGTDLELAIGTQATLPSRYAVGSGWGRRWPHTIDPAAFFDEDGKLWLVYGSWSGGIWMLELDEETGLRDYDVVYPSTGGSTDGVTSDPYFGTKIAGGYYVSGEGPYIEHIGNYYYLFVSYGFYSPDGGYEMRVFRSEKPNGPYKDAMNRSAIFTSATKNYGAGTDTRGMKLLGSYNDWGFMTVGECAQGHNSIIAAEDGRTYLVYHTKFNDGTAGHQVRVHQVFLNKNGWLVAAPFEYNGETLTDNDVATRQIVDDADIPGTYQVLFHKYKMDYENYEEVKPVELTLTADGKVTGARTGTWKLDNGTSYMTININGTPYTGVLVEQLMDGKSIKTVAFSLTSSSGFAVWGYKYRPDYAIAWQLNNQKLPLSNGLNVKKNIDLYSMQPADGNVSLQWGSSNPEIISNYGKYYPLGLQDDANVTLSARLQSGRYFWQQDFDVKALSEENAKALSDTWKDGMVAHYTFDDKELTNALDNTQKAKLNRLGTTALPTVDTAEQLRNGSTVHLKFGANGKESYVSIPNPLKGKELANGATISFFVKRTDNNLWDALFGMVNGGARLYLTGNLYMGYNSGTGNWIDINHPETVETGKLGVGAWNHVIITIQRTASSSSGGVTIYVNATKSSDRYNESLDGKEAKTKVGFDYNLLVDHLSACDELMLGKGSFWGSPDARIDDVVIYDRALSLLEVMSLNQMLDRSDKTYISDGIDELTVSSSLSSPSSAVYDLSGRRVQSVKSGLYIKDGKKFYVK